MSKKRHPEPVPFEVIKIILVCAIPGIATGFMLGTVLAGEPFFWETERIQHERFLECVKETRDHTYCSHRYPPSGGMPACPPDAD